MVQASDLLLAVWDGRPAAGRGGTAEIVEYARTLGVEVRVIPAQRAAPAADPTRSPRVPDREVETPLVHPCPDLVGDHDPGRRRIRPAVQGQRHPDEPARHPLPNAPIGSPAVQGRHDEHELAAADRQVRGPADGRRHPDPGVVGGVRGTTPALGCCWGEGPYRCRRAGEVARKFVTALRAAATESLRSPRLRAPARRCASCGSRWSSATPATPPPSGRPDWTGRPDCCWSMTTTG